MSMNTFHLQIVTPDGQVYDGPAARVLCRTIAGDVCILPRQRAETVLGQQGADDRELELAQARLKRALVRTHVANLV